MYPVEFLLACISPYRGYNTICIFPVKLLGETNNPTYLLRIEDRTWRLHSVLVIELAPPSVMDQLITSQDPFGTALHLIGPQPSDMPGYLDPASIAWNEAHPVTPTPATVIPLGEDKGDRSVYIPGFGTDESWEEGMLALGGTYELPEGITPKWSSDVMELANLTNYVGPVLVGSRGVIDEISAHHPQRKLTVQLIDELKENALKDRAEWAQKYLRNFHSDEDDVLPHIQESLSALENTPDSENEITQLKKEAMIERFTWLLAYVRQSKEMKEGTLRQNIPISLPLPSAWGEEGGI